MSENNVSTREEKADTAEPLDVDNLQDNDEVMDTSQNTESVVSANQESGSIDVGTSKASASGKDVHETNTTEQQILQYQKAIATLNAKLEEEKQNFIRVHADFENSKKRMLREKEQSIRYANQNLILDIISFIDDLERAIALMIEDAAQNSFVEGVQLIQKQLLTTLNQRWGLSSFGEVGEQFDPNCHEALATEAAQAQGENTIIEIYQRGYKLHDRLIRSAKVKVAQTETVREPQSVADKPADA